VIYAEAISNPTLVIADLPALAETAHSRVISSSHPLQKLPSDKQATSCAWTSPCKSCDKGFGKGCAFSHIQRPHVQGITFVVDNTFSPMIISPAKWGADVVVHSLTKFISGASDIIAGAHCLPLSLVYTSLLVM